MLSQAKVNVQVEGYMKVKVVTCKGEEDTLLLKGWNFVLLTIILLVPSTILAT